MIEVIEILDKFEVESKHAVKVIALGRVREDGVERYAIGINIHVGLSPCLAAAVFRNGKYVDSFPADTLIVYKREDRARTDFNKLKSGKISTYELVEKRRKTPTIARVL